MSGITQVAPFSAVCATWGSATFNLTLESMGGVDGTVYTQSTGSTYLLVDSYGHLTTTGLTGTPPQLAEGSYTATGTTGDIHGHTGTWTFTLTVTGGYPLPEAGGISIAFSTRAFSAAPNWETLSGVAAWTVDRGRPSTLDTTQAGTASITLYDTTGLYDPTNPNSPLYGTATPPTPYSSYIGPMRAVNIQLQNPTNKEFYNIFTGYTESWSWSFPTTPSNVMMQAVVACADGFEPLTRAELVPDSSNSTTFSPVNGLNAVKIRMLAVLGQFQSYTAGLDYFPTDPDAIFSGNVNILSGVYAPHTSLLSALQDAADAEFPGVANLFMDKFGNVAFRGRVPRFLPQNYTRTGTSDPADIDLPPTVNQPVQFWNVGDYNASETFTDDVMAPITDIGWTEDNASVINACQCYPGGYDSSAACWRSSSSRTPPASTFRRPPPRDPRPLHGRPPP